MPHVNTIILYSTTRDPKSGVILGLHNHFANQNANKYPPTLQQTCIY